MKARCINTKIITLTDGVSPEESIAMNTLDAPLQLLAEMGLAEYIGAMKEIIEWEMVDDNTSAEVIDFMGEK